jgi:hypothetical protein
MRVNGINESGGIPSGCLIFAWHPGWNTLLGTPRNLCEGDLNEAAARQTLRVRLSCNQVR